MSKKSNISNSTLLIIFLLVILLGSFFMYNNKNISENFSLKSNKYTVEYYFMDNCGYCTSFENEWNKFTSEVSKASPPKKYDYAKYNISEVSPGGERASKFKITGTPTIIITDSNDKLVKTYEGNRTVSSLITFADSNT